MQKNILRIIVLPALMLLFTSCVDLEREEDVETIDIQSRTITRNQSITCSDKTSFSVEPSDQAPDITIINDVANGDVTISVDSNSQGYIVVSNCVR
jgi:hypothetical protein